MLRGLTRPLVRDLVRKQFNIAPGSEAPSEDALLDNLGDELLDDLGQTILQNEDI
jgi:hypothetical protein